MNSAIGSIPCPLCAETSDVKKFARGRREGQLYVHCPKHGPFMNPGSDMQEWILTNARMHGPGGVPAPAAPEIQATPPPAEILANVTEDAAQPEPAIETPTPAPSVPEKKSARGGYFPLFGL